MSLNSDTLISSFRSELPCLIHQPKYSMFERWIERPLASTGSASGAVEASLLEVLREEGIGCIAFSPLAQGLLTGKYLTGIPADSRASKPHGFLKRDQVTEDKISKVRRLNELEQSRGQTLAQMALAWVLRHPEVTSAVIGASKVAQIEDGVGALKKLEFEEKELEAIEKILAH
jgi:L-glyceraldehyde 3-phosphate reductase